MPPKKQGVHLKDLIGREIMLLSRYGKKEEAEGPYTLTGVDVPMVCVHCDSRGRNFWLNLDYVVSITEVVKCN